MSKSEKAAAVLQASGLGALLRRIGAWRGVLVLNYHRIGHCPPWPSERGIWSATADELDTQMQFLARHFELLSAGDLVDGHAGRSGRFVMVTFDDGYRETYEVAYPILDAHNVPATFFLTTGFLDATHTPWWDELAWMVRNSSRTEVKPDGWFAAPLSLAAADRQATTTSLIEHYKTLSSEQTERFLDDVAWATGGRRRHPADTASEFITWDMARELYRAGMDIGGHTVSHPILSRLPRAEQHREIKSCLDRLEQELRARPKLFSYPVGMPDSFDSTTEACLRENGVDLAFSNYGGVIRGSNWNPRDLPRTCIASVSVSQRRFRALATLPSIFISVERRRLLSGCPGSTRRLKITSGPA
jgi:peptidoglycan/xylan/chitin deacetylase (PgdA/CDA1 family)